MKKVTNYDVTCHVKLKRKCLTCINILNYFYYFLFPFSVFMFLDFTDSMPFFFREDQYHQP